MRKYPKSGAMLPSTSPVPLSRGQRSLKGSTAAWCAKNGNGMRSVGLAVARGRGIESRELGHDLAPRLRQATRRRQALHQSTSIALAHHAWIGEDDYAPVRRGAHEPPE